MKNLLIEILEYLKSTRPSHFDFDLDNWYSCPLSEGGTSDESKEGHCTCNYQEKSEKLESLISKIEWEISGVTSSDFKEFFETSEELTSDQYQALQKAKRASSTTFPTIPGMK